jgi:DNA-binding transcriptional ArsR family regulator
VSEGELETLVKTLKALANSLRLRMIANLAQKPKHAYALAKELGISYPLAHLHLKGLKKMKLIEEVESEKRAEGLPTVKTYAPTDFALLITPEKIHNVVYEKEENMHG